MRDKLWFFGSYRTLTTAQRVEGIFGNAYAFDASHWDYKRDDTLSVRDVQGRTMYQGRFTAQPTPKNRVTFSQENQYRCQGSTETFGDLGCRTRGDDWVAMGSTTLSPEASDRYFEFPYYLTQATWTVDRDEPAADRGRRQPALVRGRSGDRIAGRRLRPDPGRRAGGHRRSPRQLRVPRHQHRRRQLPEHQELAHVGVVRDGRAQHEGRLPGGLSKARTAASITGESGLRYRFNNRVPNQFTFRLPDFRTANRTMTAALYVQDTWTLRPVDAARRAALRPGLELGPRRRQRDHRDRAVQRGADFVRADAQRGCVSTTSRRAAAWPTTSSATARRRSSSTSAATSRRPPTTVPYTQNNPASRIVTNASRNWQDGNGNYVVDCDILNPAEQATPGGDTCGALTGDALNFGKAGANLTQVNPDILRGWGTRRYDWQWGMDFQQEAGPARLAGRQLQPALVRELHGHRQPGLARIRLRGVDDRRASRTPGSPAAAPTRSRSTRRRPRPRRARRRTT